MKKAFAVIMLQIILLTGAARAFALTADVSPVAERISASTALDEGNLTLSFGELGFRETKLVSPFDSMRLLFSAPPNWKLLAGGELQIDYDFLLTGADVARLAETGGGYGGSLVVTFNNNLIGTIPLLNTGSNTVRFYLPIEALEPLLLDRRHSLKISLESRFSCQSDIRTLVTIKDTSLINLVYEASAPQSDLSRLPAPFYLADAMLPERSLIILPDNPRAAELESALNIMAGFGSMIGNPADFQLLTASRVSLDDLAVSNLIYVGMADQLGFLAGATLPLPAENGKFINAAEGSEGDGILQMTVSPWNHNKVVLVVSGENEAAVIKASQAVSSGPAFVYENPALVYVKDVNLLTDNLPTVESFSLQDLGYPTETLNGIGLDSVEYVFSASQLQVATEKGYIDLVYYHSALLDNGLSSLSIELNDQLISSAALDKASEQLTTLRITLPVGLMRYGDNRLKISAKLSADTSCDTSGFSDPWVVISDQSNFFLPVAEETHTPQSLLLDLKNYPALFLSRSDLGDAAFILPQGDFNSWNIAGKIAYDLGRTTPLVLSNLKAAYADDVPADVRERRSLIIIGRASASPLLAEINDSLPAPFDLVTDTADQRHLQIVYRVPSGVSVGYLELLHSPFNIDKAVLIISGNSEQGVTMAGNAMLLVELHNQISGLFAITNGTQVAVSNSQSLFSVVGTVIPGSEAQIATPIVPGQLSAPAFERPDWLMPVIVGLSLGALLVLGFVIRSALAGNRTVDYARDEEEEKGLPKDGKQSEAQDEVK